MSVEGQFEALARELKCGVSEAEKRWNSAKLDGDERKSLAEIFGLYYTGDGAVGTAKITSGLAKLQSNTKAPTTKSKKG